MCRVPFSGVLSRAADGSAANVFGHLGLDVWTDCLQHPESAVAEWVADASLDRASRLSLASHLLDYSLPSAATQCSAET